MPVGGSQKDRIKKSGKQKLKVVKPLKLEYANPDPVSTFNIPKGVDDDKKIKPKDVFEGYSEQKKSNGKKGISNRKKR
jgi:hypothetical protein